MSAHVHVRVCVFHIHSRHHKSLHVGPRDSPIRVLELQHCCGNVMLITLRCSAAYLGGQHPPTPHPPHPAVTKSGWSSLNWIIKWIFCHPARPWKRRACWESEPWILRFRPICRISLLPSGRSEIIFIYLDLSRLILLRSRRSQTGLADTLAAQLISRFQKCKDFLSWS